MFENITPDPGAAGLRQAALIFFVLSVLFAALGVLLIGGAILSRGAALQPLAIMIDVSLAAVAYATAKGIENQRPWAKWAGITLGVIELFNFPIGTVIGIAILVYLRRAIKAGLFAPRLTPA